MAGVNIAKDLFAKAKRYIPGGVNSPVRSFKAVGGYPVFVKRASGSKLYGECGREFIDYCLSWGALILGHAHPDVTKALESAVRKGTSFGTATKLETELAKLIVEAIPSVEQVRLTNSGTEAVMAAVRLARAYTQKNKIIKFEGSYHGHADYLLTKVGTGAAALGMPDSPGVPKDFTNHTIVVSYNDTSGVKEAIAQCEGDLAAIIVEPVAGNCGVIVPQIDFLKGLREIANSHKALLIFDEVITGFRVSYGGAETRFGVAPDLTCLGKIIGGGLPIGAFGGRKEIMKFLAPQGSVYQAGTFSGNPIAVTAGVTTLKILKVQKPYGDLENRTEEFCKGIEGFADENKVALKVNRISSMFSLFFTDKDVIDYRTAKTQNTATFKRFFHGLLKEGVYFSPSGFETNFLSTAHSARDIEKTLGTLHNVIKLIGG